MKKKESSLKGVFKYFLLFYFLLLFDVGVYAQGTITIQGTVTDQSKEPLIGVSISEKGTTNGAITNLDGAYSITVNSGATLVFTYVGCTSQEVVASRSNIDVVMQENSKVLDAVVVVGYGVQKKENLTGAVTAIDGDVISSKSSSDVLSAMQGEMPGVAVLRSSGQPGSETSGVRIRGYSSINDAKALVLIDGVEGDLTLLNSNDIASVSVLKDAAASAIYGARAAAGVILVTTKSGTEGKAKISYNGYFGINNPTRMPKRLPAWEEQQFINESRIQASGNPEWNAEQSSWIANPNFNYRPNNTNGRWDFFEATNWVDEGTKDYTTQQSHSATISGGSKDLNYLISGSYFKKNGFLKYGPDKNERYTFRAKLNAEINKYVDIAVNVNYNGKFVETNPYGATTILERLYRVRGRQPIMNPKEDINYTVNPYNGDLQVNSIQLMKESGINENRYEAYTGKGEVTLKNFIDGFRLKLSASRVASYYNSEIQKRYLVWYDRVGTGKRFEANNPNSLEKKRNYDFHDYFEALTYYDKSFEKHTFNLLGGLTYENYKKDEITATAKNLNSNDFFSFNAYDSSLPTNSTLSDLKETWAMMSYFGRLSYNFDNRYLFEANIRYDGSSRLAPGNRWKAFPSFSAAWRVNEESWFDVSNIDNLKVRASWGQLGMGSMLGLYDYLPILDSGLLMGDKYYYQKQLASVRKTWETIETTNIGVDLGMFNNHLTFTGDYYWKKNNDMLIDYTLPNLVGVDPPKGNIGTLKTWGWELQLGWRDRVGEVNYQASFNLSDSQNKLVEYNGGRTIKAGAVQNLEGYALNSIWGYETDGFWSSREEYLAYKEANPGYESFNDMKVSGGDIKYVSQRNNEKAIGPGDGTPESPGDLVYLGNSTGRYMYGFNLGVQWQGIDFSMLWQGVAKRKILIATNTIAPFQSTSNMPWTIHRNYWTEDNQDAFWPRLYNQNTFNYEPSDRWVQNAAYIRLKNVQLGYTLPISKKIADKVRLYVSGDDIWEHSDLLEVFDPEVGNEAKANYYPFFRTWTFGLNITF